MKRNSIILVAFFICLIIITGCTVSSTENSKASEPPLTASEIKDLYTNPDIYKGRIVELTGKVFHIPVDGEGVSFQIWQDPANNGNNTFIYYKNSGFTVNRDDYVKIRGTVKGKVEAKNAFNGDVVAPLINADLVEASTYKDVVAPTLKEIPVGQTLTQYGYSVTFDKIEFAETETRVYLTVSNQGSDKFSLFAFNSALIQNEKQYGEQMNYMADYPKLGTELNVGAKMEGVLCFPKIDGNTSFKLVLEGHTFNYQEQLTEYIFEITI